MKSIFDNKLRDEIINRIYLVNENSPKQWGKMSVYQMLKHCTLWDEWILGKNQQKYRQAFIGFLFGRMVLKKITKNDKPLDKNVPTAGVLRVIEINGDIDTEKAKWISLLKEYEHYSNPGFIHDFFGKMTVEQIGILAYKHTDHHLRQFSC